MKQDQEQKWHVCKFCKQGFSNGKQLGGHMRRHLALIAACKKMGIQESINGEEKVIKKMGINQDYETNCGKQSIQENEQGMINGEMGLDFGDSDEVMLNKSENEMGVDQDCRGSVYVLRENPKRSWRVSNSGKDYGKFLKKMCDSRKESVKVSVCDKCGKSFNSMKALYGHMRCHSIKRSQPLDESSMIMEHDDDDDDDGGGGGEVATPVRKKRSCTRYKSPKPNNNGASFSCSDDEVEIGAICLMMLSRGVRSLDEVKLVISNQAEFAFSDSGYDEQSLESNAVFEVSVDGSMGCCDLKKKSKLGWEKDLIFGSGSGQLNPGQARSTPVKYKVPKKPRLYDQDFGDIDAADSNISVELKRSKDHICPICFKEFVSSQALGSHKRVHTDNNERKLAEKSYIPDVHRLVNPDLDFISKVSTMVTWGSS